MSKVSFDGLQFIKFAIREKKYNAYCSTIPKIEKGKMKISLFAWLPVDQNPYSSIFNQVRSP